MNILFYTSLNLSKETCIVSTTISLNTQLKWESHKYINLMYDIFIMFIFILFI